MGSDPTVRTARRLRDQLSQWKKRQSRDGGFGAEPIACCWRSAGPCSHCTVHIARALAIAAATHYIWLTFGSSFYGTSKNNITS